MAKLNSGTRIYGNVTIDTFATATGNITGGNILTGGLISATGAVTAASVVGGVITGSSLSVSGTVTGASHVGSVVSVTGAVTGASVVGGVITGTSTSVSGTTTAASVVGGVITGSSTSVTGTTTTGGTTTSAGYISQTQSSNVMSRMSLVNSVRNWSLSNYGNQFSPNGSFNIADETGAIVRLAITTDGITSITGSFGVSGNATIGNILTGGLVSATGAITGTALTGTSLTVSTGNITGGNIVNANGNGIGNIGSTGGFFNTVFAKATSAQYADLAEKYTADADYPVGTVLRIGGIHEVSQTNSYHATNIVGTVSDKPAYVMNSGLAAEHVAVVALLGRVPCRVTGKISKGDLLVSSKTPGVAAVLDPDLWVPGCVIGKALEDYDSITEGVIEIVVGRS